VLIGTLGPILTILFGWLLLSEPVSLAQLAGAGLVLAGVLLVSRRNSAPVRQEDVAQAASAEGTKTIARSATSS
jgi:drug/metabolite transporter (DMT)-like permease